MRAAVVLTLSVLALGACSGGGVDPAGEGTGAAEDAVLDRIACAVGGSAELREDCTVERVQEDGRLSLVVRHPDGAFRRFDVMTDGTGLAVADGAEPAEVRLVGKTLDVTVGADRYVFPASPKAGTAAGDAPH